MPRVPARPDLPAGPAGRPARPDLGDGSPATPARRRPTAAFGLGAGVLWLLASTAAFRRIGWYPPPTAIPILIAGTPVVMGLGYLAARLHRGRSLAAIGSVLLAASLLVPFAMCAVMPGVAHPSQHPLPGRASIALTAAPEGNFELWLMRGDADQVSRLTDTPARELGADLSPDETQVVFASDASGTWGVYLMTLGPDDTPGPIRTLVDGDDADEFAPAWSPEGGHIAYSVEAGDRSEVWVMDANGLGGHRIASQPGAVHPTWSPDGDRIAYSAGAAEDPSDLDIWIVHPDGTDGRDEVQAAGDQWDPHWSPDGATLLFTSDVTGDQDVWTCEAACDNLRNLTADPGATDWAAGWTPDGHPLVASDRLHTDGGVFVYFIDDDGQMQLSLII